MGRRKVESAHYQHRKSGLTLVVRPPVRNTSAMAWGTGGKLVVGTADGEAYVVHPALGTAQLWQDRAPVVGLGIQGPDVVVVEAGGTWRRLDLDGKVVYEGEHAFTQDVSVQFDGRHMLLVGSTERDRRLEFYRDDQKQLRILMPPRTVAVVVGDEVRLAQSTPGGLEVITLATGTRFTSVEQTAHVLRVSQNRILGLGADEVRVWAPDGRLGARVRIKGATAACVTQDRRFLAIGTAAGGVGLVDLHGDGAEPTPSTVHVSDQAVQTLAFSDTGRWLASGADKLCVWSWDVDG